jgi:hypothetical protein
MKSRSRRECRMSGSARRRADFIVEQWRMRDRIARAQSGPWNRMCKERQRSQTANGGRQDEA